MNEQQSEVKEKGGGGKGVVTCICPNCGYEKEHEKDKPCYQVSCPQCGTLMKKL